MKALYRHVVAKYGGGTRYANSSTPSCDLSDRRARVPVALEYPQSLVGEKITISFKSNYPNILLVELGL